MYANAPVGTLMKTIDHLEIARVPLHAVMNVFLSAMYVTELFVTRIPMLHCPFGGLCPVRVSCLLFAP